MDAIHIPARRADMGENERVLFDAGKYPSYAEAKGKGLRAVRLLMIVAMAGTPAMFALVLGVLWASTESELDMPLMTVVFAVVIVADEILVYFFLRPMLLRRWESPVVVTESELRLGARRMALGHISQVVLVDGSINVQWKEPDTRFPQSAMFSAEEVGDAVELLNVIKARNPGVKVEDARRNKTV
jgi:hypothetical protein